MLRRLQINLRLDRAIGKMKWPYLRNFILLVLAFIGTCHILALLRVHLLRYVPRSVNRRPVNETAPVYLTPDSAQLKQLLATDLSAKSQAELESVYFQLISQQHVECPYYQRIGDSGEGGWDVCFTGPFNIRSSRPTCVAFSFGVDNIFGYDDELADRYKCRVYMFDPSMAGVPDHRRRATSWFYRTGLSSNNSVLHTGWKMRTLCTLVGELGLTGTTIDILKLDVEHWEWASLEVALADGCLKQVKQLMFESHTSEMLYTTSDYSRLVRVFVGLFRLGFRSWRSDENPMSKYFYSKHTGKYRACCYEHYMLNTRFISPPLV